MSGYASTSTIVINAEAEQVWRALTEPALVKQWQYGSDLLTDWTVGSPIRFVAEWTVAHSSSGAAFWTSSRPH